MSWLAFLGLCSPAIPAGGGGGTVTEPLELQQILTSKSLILSGRDGVSGDIQAGGGAFLSYAPSPDGTDYGAALLTKEANAGGYDSEFRGMAVDRNTTYKGLPGNNNVPLASGFILDCLSGPLTFNGNTAGATTETDIVAGVLPLNTAAPGHKISISGQVTLTGVNGADTLTLKIKRGGTTVISLVLVAADAAPPGTVSIYYVDLFQAIGASVNAYNQTGLSGPATGANSTGLFLADTTTDEGYSLTAQWSNNHVDNTAVIDFLNISYGIL